MKVTTYFDIDSWTTPSGVVFQNLERDKKQNTLAPRFRKETKRYVVEVEIPEVVKTEEVDPVPVFSQDGTSATFVEELTHDQTKATIVQEPVVVATVSATVAQPISGFSESHILVNLWIGTILDFYGYKSVKEVVKFHTETSGSAVDVTNSVILMSLISELAAVGATKEKIEKVKIRA